MKSLRHDGEDVVGGADGDGDGDVFFEAQTCTKAKYYTLAGQFGTLAGQFGALAGLG